MNIKKKHSKLSVTQLIVLILLLTVTFLFATISTSFAEVSIPSATSNFYVNDFAEIFSDEQEKEMMDRAVTLAYKPTGIQVVVTTVKTLDGLSVEDYANLMYNKYGIGKGDKGILILLSVKERQIRIEVGYGLESFVTDTKAGNYIRNYGLDYLKKDQFDVGLMNIQEAIITDLDAKFEKSKVTTAPKVEVTDVTIKSSTVPKEGLNENSLTPNPDSNNSSSDNLSLPVIVIFIVSVVGCLAGFVTQTIRFEKLKSRSKEEISDKKNTISDLNQTINRNKASIDNLQYEINVLKSSLENKKRDYTQLNDSYSEQRQKLARIQDKYSRAKVLHPDLENEVIAMIRKEIDDRNREVAASFDKKYSYLATQRALDECLRNGYQGYKTFEKLHQKCRSEYEALNKEQKGYVMTDMQEVDKRYKEGMLQKSQIDAENYNQSLKSCVERMSGIESNLNSFNDLLEQYDEMDDVTRGFVNKTLLQQVRALQQLAESKRRARLAREEAERKRKEKEAREAAERRREEEEEERRRASYYHSSSSSSSNHSSSFGGFGGFGGSSGGGGASSGF